MVNLMGEAKDTNLIGIIDSDGHGKDSKLLNNHIKDFLNTGGGIIYIYARGEEKDLSEANKSKLNSVCYRDKIKFICKGKEDHLKENKMDVIRLLSQVNETLIQLDKSGHKDKLVYINTDRFEEFVEIDDLQYIYKRLRNISRIRNVKFIFRYTSDSIDLDYTNILVTNHDLLLIEKENKLASYISQELMVKSLDKILDQPSERQDQDKDKANKKIERLKGLGEMMEGAIHDINNLMATISGYSQLALISENLLEITGYLEIINKTALDGKNAVENIKSYTKDCSTGKSSYYNFDSIINNCIMMSKYKFKSLYLKTRKELAIDISLNSNAFIHGNEYEIRQSILNIIFNGVDAMEGDGILTIKTYDHNRQAVVEISDTGMGIDKENIDKIFNPYFTTKQAKGTGLGLNIVKKMVEKHNGNIKVDSQLGKGSKFTLSFPIAKYKTSIGIDKNKAFKNALKNALN